MGEYIIEKNIPIPVGYNTTDGMREVLVQMEIGDSVVFKSNECKRARNQAYQLKSKTFTFRSQKNGYRCWRTA
jgi:hypothetical protein